MTWLPCLTRLCRVIIHRDLSLIQTFYPPHNYGVALLPLFHKSQTPTEMSCSTNIFRRVLVQDPTCKSER